MMQNLTNQIIQNQKKLLLAGSLFAILSLAVWLYSSFTYVYLTVGEVPAGIQRDTLSIKVSDGYTYTKTTNEGFLLLPKSIKTITVKAGKTISSQIALNVPWYRFIPINTDLQYSKDANATSFSSLTGSRCAVYDDYSEQLVGYNCNKPSNLISTTKNDQGYWTTTATETFGYINNHVSPYKNGLIGPLYTQDNGPSVGVVDARGQRQIYRLPKEITFDDLRTNKIVTDTTDSTNSNVVIIRNNGEIYTATPQKHNQPVAYKKYSPPKGYDHKNQQTLCTIKAATAYCYRGAHIQGDQQLPDIKDRQPATISTLSFNEQRQTTRQIADPMIEEIHVTAGGTIYVRNYMSLYKAVEHSTSYSLQNVAQQVSSVSANKSLYYTSSNGVYRLSDGNNQATQVFYSPHIDTKRIYAVNNKVFVLGSVKNSSKQLYAYEITPNDYTEAKKRLIDQFPTQQGEIPGVLSQKLVDNTLYVSVATPITKTTTPAPEDTNKRNDIQQKVETLIRERVDGLDVSIEFQR